MNKNKNNNLLLTINRLIKQ